jgi:hypothetical protein
MIDDQEFSLVLWFIGLPVLLRLALNLFLTSGDARLLIPLRHQFLRTCNGSDYILQFVSSILECAHGDDDPPLLKRQILKPDIAVNVLAAPA